mmetsp:Transcript_17130/g.34748  ORF Transcript_17130/g.34748 Transcript_17130/m.34748 type:complete len:140 (+) Transcript_17130:687-1106(+)
MRPWQTPLQISGKKALAFPHSPCPPIHEFPLLLVTKRCPGSRHSAETETQTENAAACDLIEPHLALWDGWERRLQRLCMRLEERRGQEGKSCSLGSSSSGTTKQIKQITLRKWTLPLHSVCGPTNMIVTKTAVQWRPRY